jgi:hypothetical protein
MTGDLYLFSLYSLSPLTLPEQLTNNQIPCTNKQSTHFANVGTDSGSNYIKEIEEVGEDVDFVKFCLFSIVWDPGTLCGVNRLNQEWLRSNLSATQVNSLDHIMWLAAVEASFSRSLFFVPYYWVAVNQLLPLPFLESRVFQPCLRSCVPAIERDSNHPPYNGSFELTVQGNEWMESLFMMFPFWGLGELRGLEMVGVEEKRANMEGADAVCFAIARERRGPKNTYMNLQFCISSSSTFRHPRISMPSDLISYREVFIYLFTLFW